MSGQRGGRGPGIPTPLLAAVVVLCLAGAGWLFLAGGNSDKASDADTAAEVAEEPERERADSELTLPGDDDPTDERRRGEEGRDRVDPDAPSDDAEDADDDAAALPAVLESVRGRDVALVAASAPGSGDASRTVRTGDLRMDCAGLADPTRLRDERELLDRLQSLLERAGATVDRVDTDDACVDRRIARMHEADLAIVVRVGINGSHVTAGRAARSSERTDTASSALATELAGALELDEVKRPKTAADRTRLATLGAVDLPDGAAIALVEVDPRSLDDSARQALALDLATAIGIAASRADVDGSDARD